MNQQNERSKQYRKQLGRVESLSVIGTAPQFLQSDNQHAETLKRSMERQQQLLDQAVPDHLLTYSQAVKNRDGLLSSLADKQTKQRIATDLKQWQA